MSDEYPEVTTGSIVARQIREEMNHQHQLDLLRHQLSESQRQITQARISEVEWLYTNVSEPMTDTGYVRVWLRNRIAQLKAGGDETCPITVATPTSGSPAPEVTNGASTDEALYWLNKFYPETQGQAPVRVMLDRLAYEHWHRGMTEAAEIAVNTFPHLSGPICRERILDARDKKP